MPAAGRPGDVSPACLSRAFRPPPPKTPPPPRQWGRDTAALARDIIDEGIEAVLTCVDPKRLSPSFAGRRFDAQLLADLPPGVDPCGAQAEGPGAAMGLAMRGRRRGRARQGGTGPAATVVPAASYGLEPGGRSERPGRAQNDAPKPRPWLVPNALGENGEFHTFVVAAPALFDRPIEVGGFRLGPGGPFVAKPRQRTPLAPSAAPN
jgi:hypothetical protein